jgi:antitoxin FitA
MEENAQKSLRQTVGDVAIPNNLGRTIHARFAAIGGVERGLPRRGPMRAARFLTPAR